MNLITKLFILGGIFLSVTIWLVTDNSEPAIATKKLDSQNKERTTLDNSPNNPFSLITTDIPEETTSNIVPDEKPTANESVNHEIVKKVSPSDYKSSNNRSNIKLQYDTKNQENSSERPNKLTEADSAAQEGRWDAFIEIAAELGQTRKDQFETTNSITIAIENNAPYWVFEKLVAQGHRFTTDHTLLIAAKNRNDLMNGFRVLGIDIHATAPDGKNAVYAALENFQAHHTFANAIHSDVAPQNTVNGLDTLDYALTEAVDNYNNETCSFIYILILYGEVELDDNHYELLRNLEKKNNDMFECIMRSVHHVITYTY